jgi:hypothetical protein
VSEVPPYLKPSAVGKACRMSRRQAKAFLKRAGILELIGGHWEVSTSRLREALPGVYDRVYAHIALGSEATQSDSK